MGRDIVGDHVRFAMACMDCGAEVEASAGQSLVYGRLEWSVETDCLACGPVLACGRGDTPDDLRARRLDHGVHGPAGVELTGEAEGRAAMVMKVLRAELRLGLVEARTAVGDIRAGRYTGGTLPEMARLVDALRAAGIEARTVARR
ncbi:hypothetical protein [Streptomyces laurentii]|uniref:hypothetical protein n=1 Tax=Streptomyces laurentii TaxID=39478 RepID=UPI00369DC74A